MRYAGADPLDIGALRTARAGKRIGGDIHYFESLASTSTTAREYARNGCPEGTVIIAETQTHGRGRLGRTWESPPFRNLYTSIVLRPTIEPAQAPQIALVAGLATAEAAIAAGAPAKIKWPNDVLIEGRKTAGLLAEMDSDGDTLHAVILGIGVNLNLAHDELPEELRSKATSLAEARKQPVERHTFADLLLSALEERYDQFLGDGFAAVREAWDGLSSLRGQRVEVDANGVKHAGKAVGLDADGALLLTEKGETTRVVAGDVTIIDGYKAS